ncbi:hypothetical protein C8J57DRAFT_1624806 [Mycena rebaudengoi]|nr:hypothetical protein C8J57DRAFT_1624806 [Mycena rebaudengoi]
MPNLVHLHMGSTVDHSTPADALPELDATLSILESPTGPAFTVTSLLEGSHTVSSLKITTLLSKTQDALDLIERANLSILLVIELRLTEWDEEVLVAITHRLYDCQELRLVFQFSQPTDEFLFNLGIEHFACSISMQFPSPKSQKPADFDHMPMKYRFRLDALRDTPNETRLAAVLPDEAACAEYLAVWTRYNNNLRKVRFVEGREWTRQGRLWTVEFNHTFSTERGWPPETILRNRGLKDGNAEAIPSKNRSISLMKHSSLKLCTSAKPSVFTCFGCFQLPVFAVWVKLDRQIVDVLFTCRGITTKIITPTPLIAVNFILLARIIGRLGRFYSRLTPQWYTRIFLSCDIVALVIKVLVVESPPCVVDFLRHYSQDYPVWQSPSYFYCGAMDQRLKRMIDVLVFSTLVLFIRSIYRVIEMAGGWTGRIITTEVYFNLVQSCWDGGMIAFAMLTINFAHPGFLLGSEQQRNPDGQSNLSWI